ncbi:hypothetical protein [Allostreptomyces psammosilenae]|uniref:Uncharacterized protein n=1 Tax=Allostreptomyces psammosilenae TaxID=1892865 RepID=A0A852ZS42_9ACTN|nr:hypothetical protein [Allostreptomyces psammosilenae]NYI04287.1 hypothetical protein [Allostreptomyces psammosilenae]
MLFAGDHPCHWAGPLERVIAAAERILGLGPEVVVPGHGGLLDAAGVREHIGYLERLRDHAADCFERGVDLPEATARFLADGGFELGLPERVLITLATEYRHLRGGDERPDLVAAVGAAARLAWEWEHHPSRSPGPAPSGPEPSAPGGGRSFAA